MSQESNNNSNIDPTLTNDSTIAQIRPSLTVYEKIENYLL